MKFDAINEKQYMLLMEYKHILMITLSKTHSSALVAFIIYIYYDASMNCDTGLVGPLL